MGQVSSKMRRVTDGYIWWCPACQEIHWLPDKWKFNGDFEHPTFRPSFKHPDCHYVITSGIVKYEADCKHALAGKLALMPPLPAWLCDPPNPGCLISPIR